jgi:hypothetical protein
MRGLTCADSKGRWWILRRWLRLQPQLRLNEALGSRGTMDPHALVAYKFSQRLPTSCITHTAICDQSISSYQLCVLLLHAWNPERGDLKNNTDVSVSFLES